MRIGVSLSVVSFLFVVGVFAQGTINFANLVVVDGVRIVDAPVFQFDNVRASGSQFQAEMLAGPTSNSLSPIGLSTPLLTGVEAGYFSGGIRTVDSVPPGGVASVEIRVWDTASGATWDLALSREYFAMQIITGGFNGAPAANLVPLPSLCLGPTPCIPEPSTLALLLLGALILGARLCRSHS